MSHQIIPVKYPKNAPKIPGSHKAISKKTPRKGKKGVATMIAEVVLVRNARNERSVPLARMRKKSMSRILNIYSSEAGVTHD